MLFNLRISIENFTKIKTKDNIIFRVVYKVIVKNK